MDWTTLLLKLTYWNFIFVFDIFILTYIYFTLEMLFN